MLGKVAARYDGDKLKMGKNPNITVYKASREKERRGGIIVVAINISTLHTM